MNLLYFLGGHVNFPQAIKGCDIMHLLYFLGGHVIFMHAKEIV
jgi:hypothetical protein